MAALLVLALAFTLLLPWHVEARRQLAQGPAPGPAAHAQGNEAAQSTTSLPSSAYVTVTVVGTAVLMSVAGLAAYQYRRRKRLERERLARLEREALEQLEQQRRLARLAKAALEPVTVFIPPIILNPDASVSLAAAARCSQQHPHNQQCNTACAGCSCCSRGFYGRRMLVRPGQTALARISLQQPSATTGCGGLQFDVGSVGSPCSDEEGCGSDASGSCAGKCGWDAGSSSGASARSACCQPLQQSAAEASHPLPAAWQQEAPAEVGEQAERARHANGTSAADATSQPGTGVARTSSCPALLNSFAQID
ncbi:hypothetical protein ABPG77_009400 [Micractinium sp. CCAP 211/92]